MELTEFIMFAVAINVPSRLCDDFVVAAVAVDSGYLSSPFFCVGWKEVCSVHVRRTRSSPFIAQSFSLHRFQIRHSSTSSPASSLLNTADPVRTGFGRTALSTALAGSGVLGLLLYGFYSFSPTLNFESIASLVDRSTPNSEDQKPRRSFFPKFSLPESSGLLLGDEFRRNIFFNYEKRMRLRSPPEKVFEYFASDRSRKGEVLMKPADLMRAVVPVFPPSESNLVRDGYLEGERSPGHLRCPPSEFFMLFDVNNDGLISFKEYIFFVTLLSIPESSFTVAFKMFDINNNGEISKEEFKKVMALMRSRHRQGVHHRDGLRTGLKVNHSVEDGGLVEYFFDKDGNGCLQHDKFVKFLRDLHDEILRLEFAHYDYKSQQTISAKDFALSMVASADMSHLSRLLKRVDMLNDDPCLKDARITFEDFKNFAELRKKLLPFSLAVFSFGEVNGLLTRDDFQRAASQVCGISLSDNVVEIVFHLFDTNRDGNLSFGEFVRVLHQREWDIAQPVEKGIMGWLSSFWNCSNNSFSSSGLFS
ncbi:calcium uptake protein, mitochondrial [Vigna radiata var. radiata]|uniref:Calcium uptake protein, mitochondrial n=1 Tax=Vigna radiata var. radiata TaxID=3916 RepID=A0A1S3UER2_VIGRR|nr:calcium uptake protein, mitochondrial [Vigna radiata var. radiata]XP_014504528.1 calcium uptake protein, mitochondrial [Vigna radiata var. radiata]XP_022638174.1 calcium uptake protein, mitochondrial [Vigna radiata var. radiata]